MSLHESNLAQKAQIIVEHFRDHVRHQINGHAKALGVTRSRLHAVRYHQAINAYIQQNGYDRGPDAMKSLVAFSGTVTDPEAPSVVYTEAAKNCCGTAPDDGVTPRILPVRRFQARQNGTSARPHHEP